MAHLHIEGEFRRKDGVLVTYMGQYNDGYNPGYQVKAYGAGDLLGTYTGQMVSVDMNVQLEEAIRALIHARIDDAA